MAKYYVDIIFNLQLFEVVFSLFRKKFQLKKFIL